MRIWFLLFVAFSLVFAIFVNHDLLVLKNDHEIWVKHKATSAEIAIGSAVAGLILSSVTTTLYFLIEDMVAPLFPPRPLPSSERMGN